MESEARFNASNNGSPPSHKYALPYDNSVLDSFLVVAENAAAQAEGNRDACLRAMMNNENTMSDIMPAFPHMQENYSPSLVYSTRSTMLSAESAYQAQSSVCEALHSAIAVADEERQKLQQRQIALSAEIKDLERRASTLRQNISMSPESHSPNGDVYATDNAKRLLSILETAYQKHDLNKKIQQHLSETTANISYLREIEVEAKTQMEDISKIAQKAQEEWRLVLQVFQVGPEQYQQQTEAMAAFQQTANPLPGQPAAPVPAAGSTAPPQNPPEATREERKEAATERTASPSFLSVLWAYLKIVIVAFLMAFVLRAYVFDLTMVDGTSMDPTLANEDKLITGKINYHFTEPRRGDIVVLNAPDMPGHDYIKRIIGLPNERITIQNGKVYINSELLIEPYLDNLPTYGDIDMIIPDGYYFVMGDNRTESRDSREEKIGVISKDAINGKAIFRLLPFDRFGGIY
ncbi:MAG: signal peptidase I [Bacillota bacterium]|nr:signal peptidase I [Bacillota bacterium]